MGYLDSTAITVDAVLTKKGRQIIAQGGSLDIQTFTLSDTGVDYTLWNADHASGSAFYGEAIENLPQVEALTNSQYATRNKLVSLARDTIAMPALEVEPSNPNFTTLNPKAFNINVLGYSAGAGITSGNGIQLLIPDVNVLTSNNGTSTDVTGNALSFIIDADIPNARIYELTGACPNYTFNLTPAGNLTTEKTITLTFMHIASGAHVTSQVTVGANLQPQGQTLSGQGQN